MMIKVVSYTLDGKTEHDMLSNSHNIAGVIAWAVMFAVVVLFLSWWIIPIRKLGIHDIKFYCDKNEKMRSK